MAIIHTEKIYIKMSTDYAGDWDMHYPAEFLGAFDRAGYEQDIMKYYEQAKAYLEGEIDKYTKYVNSNLAKINVYSMDPVNFSQETEILIQRNKGYKRTIETMRKCLENKFNTIFYYLPYIHIEYMVGYLNDGFKYCNENTEAEYAENKERLQWELMS